MTTPRVTVPVADLERVRDLLMGRIHGSPARSPAHNARLEVEAMLSAAPAPEGGAVDEVTEADAPAHLSAEGAYGWACGYNAARAAVATREEAPAGVGSTWTDARNVFVRYAELFAMTERYEEASAIADKAAREIEALATVAQHSIGVLLVAAAALEPFARAADGLDGLWSEDDWRWNDSVRSGVTVRDIRRARQALAALQAEVAK